MSRWAEMFVALSHGSDTVDSVDTVGVATAVPTTVSQSVNCVTGAEWKSGAEASTNSEQSRVADTDAPLDSAVPSQGVDTADTIDTATLPAPADEALSSFNSFLSSPGNADDLDERAALIEEGANIPRRWAEGFTAMSSMPAPTGFSPERWARIVGATGTFLDRWAADAIKCGWSDLDVFGCDAAAPDRRFDCMGLVLLLDRWEVSGVDEAGADLVTETGAPLRYRRRPLPGHTVSLWQLVK